MSLKLCLVGVIISFDVVYDNSNLLFISVVVGALISLLFISITPNKSFLTV